jgi:drug/metabolite transporter (DMT)-like permease
MTATPSRPAQQGVAPIHVILMVFIGVVYPLLFMANNIAVGAGTPAIAFTFWQTFGAALILFAIGAVRGELPRLEWAHVRAYFIMGLTGIAAPISLLAWLSTKLPVGIISVIVILSPPITYALALAFGLERLKLLSLMGIVCGLAGILLLIVPELDLPESGMVWWLLLALLAPALFALTNILAVLIRPPDSPPVSFACGLVSAASVLLLPAMFLFGQAYIFPGPSVSADLAILGASVITCLMYVIFLVVVKTAGPVFFSQFNYVIVVAGLGWGILLKGESYSPNVWLAAALMLAGVVFLTWSGRRNIVPDR